MTLTANGYIFAAGLVALVVIFVATRAAWWPTTGCRRCAGTGTRPVRLPPEPQAALPYVRRPRPPDPALAEAGESCARHPRGGETDHRSDGVVSIDPVGIPEEEGIDGGPVLVLADFDRIGRMWNAWAIVDELGDVRGAFVDVEGVVQWEGGSVGQARGIVSAHCR